LRAGGYRHKIFYAFEVAERIEDPVQRRAWASSAPPRATAWRSSASRANGSDGMPTPVDDFRHHPTSHRFLKAIVDLLLFTEPFDLSRYF